MRFPFPSPKFSPVWFRDEKRVPADKVIDSKLKFRRSRQQAAEFFRGLRVKLETMVTVTVSLLYSLTAAGTNHYADFTWRPQFAQKLHFWFDSICFTRQFMSRVKAWSQQFICRCIRWRHSQVVKTQKLKQHRPQDSAAGLLTLRLRRCTGTEAREERCHFLFWFHIGWHTSG